MQYRRNPACVLGLINLYTSSSGDTPQITFIEDPCEELPSEIEYIPSEYVNDDFSVKEGAVSKKVKRVLSYDRFDEQGTDHGRVE